MIKVYHGSNIPVPFPQISKGRKNVDFGLGFYVTDNYEIAEKWASHKKDNAVISEYELDINKLKTYRFNLDSEWLNYVIANRNGCSTNLDIRNYDVIIGPIVDEKMFSVIEYYENGWIDSETAIEVLVNFNAGIQFCLITQDSIDTRLRFVNAYTISPARREVVYMKINNEYKDAVNCAGRILRKHCI